ncbi:MAG TPA: TonB family protein [Alphaproteobacteria bacterium]|nr:TonB family protein [Alphaproteobacteria bacterium]
MATSVFATWQGGAVRDERAARGAYAGLSAANSNQMVGRSIVARPVEGQTQYRAAGLYENRWLSWPAWVAALALHGAVALIAVGLGWTSVPPSPLPDTVTVVFEPAPALVLQPAPPAAQPPVSTARPELEPLPAAVSPAPTAAPAEAVAVLPMPMPPPPRPRPEPVARASSQPASPSAPVEPVAPVAITASPQVAAAPAAVPVVPPRPASGMAGNRKPVYPLAARSRHLEGRVMLQVEVAASGNPLAVRVVSSSGHSLLDESALEAVRTWRFVPASQAGQAVAGSVDVPVDFRMAD